MPKAINCQSTLDGHTVTIQTDDGWNNLRILRNTENTFVKDDGYTYFWSDNQGDAYRQKTDGTFVNQIVDQVDESSPTDEEKSSIKCVEPANDFFNLPTDINFTDVVIGWGDNEYTKIVPKPTQEAIIEASTSEAGFSASMNWTTADVQNYVATLKAIGYVPISNTNDIEDGSTYYSFTGVKDGFAVSVTSWYGASSIVITKQ